MTVATNLALLIAAHLPHSDLAPDAASPALAPAHAEQLASEDRRTAASFTSEYTVAWQGRTRVVAFELDAAAESDTRFEVTTSDAQVLRVVQGGRVLAGETLGWLRVEALEEGSARLTLGDAQLEVLVRPLPAHAPIGTVAARVTVPADGAVVWGTFSVGVEVDTGLELSPSDLDVYLEVNGDRIEPGSTALANAGPTTALRFTVDADALPTGIATLRACVRTPDGRDIDAEPVHVRVVRADPSELFTVECEDLVDAERPADFGGENPSIGAHPGASGGAFVVQRNGSDEPLLRFDAPTEALYQAFVVARGDHGAGAYPSLGIAVGDIYDVRSASRVIDRSWHRIPVGAPLRLDAGENLVALRFLNDAAPSRESDRNLYLDRFELLPVEPAGADGVTGMGGVMNMPAMAFDGTSRGRGMWIGLELPFDGLPAGHRLSIQGVTRWTGASATGPPEVPHVALHLNGEVVAHQFAARPDFALDRAALVDGVNTIQLVAELEDGSRAETPVQRVYADGDAARGDPAPRATHAFSSVDPRWDADHLQRLSGEDELPGHRVAIFEVGDPATLDLPFVLEGRFEVIVRAHTPDGTPPARMRVSTDGDAEPSSGVVRGWWEYWSLGEVVLEQGRKTLTLEVEAPGDEGRGDRVEFETLLLRERRDGPDHTPPNASIVYPAPGHAAHGLDAVVVRAGDDDRVTQAELLVDGRPTGVFAAPPSGAGWTVVPLPLRDVAPGDHTVSVRVTDAAGNLGESLEVPFTVLAEAPRERGTYARAVHLLDRLGHGPSPQDLAQLLVEGERAWLERVTATGAPDAGDRAAIGTAIANMSAPYEYQVRTAVLMHTQRTSNPVRARFVGWVENHFSTWMGKVGAASEWSERRAYTELGFAPFSELLLTSATSATMLEYLDQPRSFGAALNENYARELMELHTLGVHGGYEQADVTELARLLAGLTVCEEALLAGTGGLMQRELRFDPLLGDGATGDVVGMRFDPAAPDRRWDRLMLALETLAAHPSTARHVSGELARHYVSDPVPDGLVDDLAAVFTRSGGDLREVLLALVAHEAFWDAPTRVATPHDYAVRLVRACWPQGAEWAVQQFLARSGMAIYDRASPDGWPEDDASWVDTNGLMQRWSLPDEIPWAVRNLVAGGLRERPSTDEHRWLQRVVDVAAARVTGRLLSPTSNAVALEYGASLEGQAWEVVDRLCIFVAQLPEASLR